MVRRLGSTATSLRENLGGFFSIISEHTHSTFDVDGLVKSLKSSFSVIPAKAGIQCFQILLDACLRRHDEVSDFLRDHRCWAFISCPEKRLDFNFFQG